ncbi:MAG: TetR/AcrR family transcriptional regulator [Acidimicrobiales bacterium]
MSQQVGGSMERWRRVLDARTSRERGRRTLARLLDAAVAEFSAYSYHGARVARVAKRARTSHGTFYVYFDDKDDLLVAMQDEIIAEMDDLLGKMPDFEPGPAGLATLRAWLSQVCDLFLEHSAIHAALLDAIVEDADPRITKQGLRAQGRWTTALADRITAADAAGIDPYLAAVCIYNLIDRATRSTYRGQLVVSFDELVDGLTELVHRSVFGSDEPNGAPLRAT